jgi:phosphatidylserine decarboxylase
MFHKEGTKTILFGLILRSIIIIWLFYWYHVVTEATSNWCFLILIIILQFFRNPKRRFTINENQILSPVDGKVVVIKKYTKVNITKISV